MHTSYDDKLLDYYCHYCEMAIWLKKIIAQSSPRHVITIQDIAEEFISERNRILQYIPVERRKALRRKMNKVALGFYSKVSGWSKKQNITVDMV